MKKQPIYVEIPIHTQLDKLWDATQKPDMHEQWDLRFSSITYMPKLENEPQHFLYETKIGFGLNIEGWGKSIGTHHAESGSRTSSLHFGTDQAVSIIREGRGYWKYIPNGDTVTFLTQYDYDVNFGRTGKRFDQIVFRPLIGWATALSFDVLKRWLEKGESPSSQFLRFFSSWMLTFLFFFIWAYHGLFPKIVSMHPEEISMVQSLLPLTTGNATLFVILVGIGELLFGATWLLYANKRRLFRLQLVLFPLLTLLAVVAKPHYLIHPFNPLTFNTALFILSVFGYLMSKDIPSAKSCKRKRSGDAYVNISTSNGEGI